MCESTVYLKEGENEKVIAREAVAMFPKDEGFVIVDISGNRISVERAEIEYIDFIKHKVVLKKK
mgnify:CR=1 FL=1